MWYGKCLCYYNIYVPYETDAYNFLREGGIDMAQRTDYKMYKQPKTKKMQRSTQRKQKNHKIGREQKFFLLVSLLIFSITAIAFVQVQNKRMIPSVTSGKVSHDMDNQNEAVQVNEVHTFLHQNEAFATGNYANVYTYLQQLTPIKNENTEMKLGTDGYYYMQKTQPGAHFQVLQITDMHITGTEGTYQQDLFALKAVQTLVAQTQPDFLVLTGDIIFGRDGYDANDGLRAVNVVSNFMDILGIPWTWCFGNHDHSFFDQYPPDTIAALLSQCKTLSLYRKNESVTGYTTGMYQLLNPDGSLAMGLVLMDSGNETVNPDGTTGYDYIRADAVNWYEQEIRKLQAKYAISHTMLFFHIPLQEYEQAWDTGLVQFGRKRENVFCSSYHSTLFEKASELGSSVAMFCGHDHLNDYGAFYNNIELVYGKSIDYIAYEGIANQTEQRGATLIDIAPDSAYTITQIPYAQ